MPTRFPNKAGDHEDTDEILLAELHAAGILDWEEAHKLEHPNLSFPSRESLRKMCRGEVKTSVRGILGPWTFSRAWYYWIAEGPGLDLERAMNLHNRFGNDVRVAGHCNCPSPLEGFQGFGTGYYHVDSLEGLKALAEAIKDTMANPVKLGRDPEMARLQQKVLELEALSIRQSVALVSAWKYVNTGAPIDKELAEHAMKELNKLMR